MKAIISCLAAVILLTACSQSSKVYSFTHKRWNTIHVSAEYLTNGERVLRVFRAEE